MSKKQKKQKKALQALYEQVPKIECRGLCHESCGPIGMSGLEAQILEARLGHSLPANEHVDCPFLTEEKRCAVYAYRPLVCRLWGVTDGIECPHGCVHERMLSYGEGMSFLLEADALSGGSTVLLYPPGWEERS